ncbi:flagellar biosynthesis protein FlhG [Paenibacillus sp. UNCCL117]|uniref:MinD/ParA family protein n=1 Tax=unclassified Paenibacillus TaxID=185978 RepID=UPI000889C1BA|nr:MULTISPECIES: MinD/ParA family protein [unclassified Paenibacillus]SDC86790.1 flagellar biosynthesis protein FlhG [Paenibacillus sp. cl123]SFW27901.1 flagellar biosynthesis protein FlhG [Paenibacillus sp. UNCCL117]
MSDQAQELRNLIKHQSAVQGERPTRIITVTSGKGGVGKSNFTLNFALALQQKGFKVLIFDADIGLANIDVLMGVSSPYSLYHLLKREKTVWDIINTGPQGLQFIAGGSGFNDLIRLSEEQLDYFAEQVGQLNGHVDFILFDTGAGLSKETLKFILAAQETIVVTTPEPTSITDAYAIIKMVHSMDYDVKFRLVVNRVLDWKEGRQTADKISMVAKQFMNLDIPTIGYVMDDSSVSKAVRKQVPFSLAFPDSAAAKSLNELTQDFLSNQMPAENQGASVKGFLNRMIRMLKP